MGELGELITSLGSTSNALYDDTHVIKALLLAGQGPIGRKRLVRELNLGEGSVRTLIGKLKDQSIIIEDRMGCSLTERGRGFFRIITRHLSLGYENLTKEHPYETAVIIRGAAEYVGRGLQERDNAIKAGADGALVISSLKDGIWFPTLTNLSSEYPVLARKIEGTDIKVGDVMIISWGSDRIKAESGALHSAIELLKKMGV